MEERERGRKGEDGETERKRAEGGRFEQREKEEERERERGRKKARGKWRQTKGV